MGKVSYVLGKAVTFEMGKCSFLYTPRCPVGSCSCLGHQLCHDVSLCHQEEQYPLCQGM